MGAGVQVDITVLLHILTRPPEGRGLGFNPLLAHNPAENSSQSFQDTLESNSRIQQAMELTTGLAVRVKINGFTAAIVPGAHRDPTPLDWKRWAPTIAARYKSEPARVLIGEMNAQGLHVTYVLSLVTRIDYISIEG